MRLPSCPTCDAIGRLLSDYSDPRILCPRCAPSVGSRDPMPRAIKPQCNVREDEEDDDRPRKKKSSGGTGSSGGGMGVGMIVVIVVGVLTCCLCLPVAGIVVALVVPAVQKVREAASATETQNHAKQVALGSIAHYHVHLSLASPRMPNSPDLSWRVSILPDMEHKDLFNQFDKAKSWNDPANQAPLNRMPLAYQSALHPAADGTHTNFMYFTGPSTPFVSSLAKVNLIRDFPDGSSNTFLFSESGSTTPWSKDADMKVQPQGALPLPKTLFVAAMGDGAVRRVNPVRTNENTLRLLINPRDGQPIPGGWDR